MRRALVALAAAVVLTLLPALPSEAANPVEARKAAQERANAAAGRWARASTALAQVEAELAAVRHQEEETKARLGALEQRVKDVAIGQYVSGGPKLPLPLGTDLGASARGQAMVEFVTLGNTDAIDEYRATREDLAIKAAEVDRVVNERRALADRLRAERAAAYAELQRMVAIEREYLARQKAEREAAARRASVTRTARARVIGTGSWICPVQGPRAFSDDFGDPRSGGRRHQGNDILSPRGTPVVASVAGTVSHRSVSLGGLSYYLRGDDGNTYFGTHMSRYGASGRVSAGTVIGYVGDTGNASGTPHLHFEIHPGGGAAINPYPTLRTYC
jgi:murein DD-endopeptidase MepM/ murein hydrolase activator NlpD